MSTTVIREEYDHGKLKSLVFWDPNSKTYVQIFRLQSVVMLHTEHHFYLGNKPVMMPGFSFDAGGEVQNFSLS
jgi:hypothetical protein